MLNNGRLQKGKRQQRRMQLLLLLLKVYLLLRPKARVLLVEQLDAEKVRCIICSTL
jgi:hypothetical protein